MHWQPLNTHQRHVVAVTAATQEKEAVSASCCRGIHPCAWTLAGRLHALPLVRFHGSIECPGISQRLRLD